MAEELGIALGREQEPPWTILAQDARQAGRRLWDHPEAADSLAFDILEPCLEYVTARHHRPVDRLVLFGTDQPERLVAEHHRQKDTLHLAAVMARRYQEQVAVRVRKAEARQVKGINAALYDEAFEAYGKLLADLPREVVACYLVITGGMPACNAALLLQGVRRWAERARVLYVPEGGAGPRELRAGEQILASFRRAVVEAHLQRLDFSAAWPLMATIDVLRALRGLAAYGQQRLDLNFDLAQETLLAEVERFGNPETRRFLDTVRHDLDPLLEEADSTGRLRALLAELYWNSETVYEQRRYADFTARVYRFQEAVLRYLVETIYSWPTDLGPKARQATVDAWNQALLADTRLMTYLTEKGVNGWPLTARQINRFSFNALLAYAREPDRGQGEEAQPIVPPDRQLLLQAQLKRLNAFDGLVELRHRSVVGHDFEGVSLVKIHAAYPNGEKDDQGQPDPVKGMRLLLMALGVDVRHNPYRRLAEFIAYHLQES